MSIFSEERPINFEEFEDVTTMFLRLQEELVPANVGERTSLEAQLKIVETDLRDLFVNTERLSACLGVGGLTYEHAFLKKTEDWSRQQVAKLLAEYRSAQKANQTELSHELMAFLPHQDEAYKHVVNIAHLEADKAKLKPSLFAKSCLRDLGDFIESGLLPFLRLRMKVLKISGKYNFQNRRTDEFSLGNLVSALSRIDSTLYCPEPFKIPVNQWRNISHHSSYKIVADKIVCKYGMPPRVRTLECQPDDLIKVFINVQNTYYAHKVAYEVFLTDNLDLIREPSNQSDHHVELSEFTTDATMAYSIVASGFKIINAGRKGPRWGFVLLDRHDRNKLIIKRALQDAVIPYVLHRGPTEVYLWVESQGDKYSINFSTETKESTELTGNEDRVCKLGKNFRIEKFLARGESNIDRE